MRNPAPIPSFEASMPTFSLLVLALTLAITAPRSVMAQADSVRTPVTDTATMLEVRLTDGSVIYGSILSADSTRVVLLTVSGVRLELRPEQIRSQRRSAGTVVKGEFWPEDPNHTRLLFTSTGRSLGAGQGYVSAYFLFFPMVAYGVTDRFTIAGGTPIVPGGIGEVFYIAPKLTVSQKDRSAVAIGALAFGFPKDTDDGTVGIGYGVGTFGSRDHAITAGAGWGFRWGGGESSVSNAPVLVLGGETRIGRRTKLLTENWVFTSGAGGFTLLSGAVRFIGDRLSADLGVIGAAEDGVGCCLPMVNFVWNFGRETPRTP
jgi:hypothetical protein